MRSLFKRTGKRARERGGGDQETSPSPSAPTVASGVSTRVSGTEIATSEEHLPVRPSSSQASCASVPLSESSHVNDGLGAPTSPPAPLNADAPASSDADATYTPSPPERVWDWAYNELKKEDAELLDAYEKILSRILDKKEAAIPSESAQQANIIDQANPARRRDQMRRLIDAGLERTKREALVKKHIGAVSEVVLAARGVVSKAIEAMPQAALAWTGVCVALEVSPSRSYCAALC